jgi:hypothetical protein
MLDDSQGFFLFPVEAAASTGAPSAARRAAHSFGDILEKRPSL